MYVTPSRVKKAALEKEIVSIIMLLFRCSKSLPYSNNEQGRQKNIFIVLIYIYLLHFSMMASPTATNHAMLSSLGPKVTARGGSQPTSYLHLKQNVTMLHAESYSRVISSQEMFYNLSWLFCSLTTLDFPLLSLWFFQA